MESHKVAKGLDAVAMLPRALQHLIFTLVYGERCDDDGLEEEEEEDGLEEEECEGLSAPWCTWKIATFYLCEVCQKENCCEKCENLRICMMCQVDKLVDEHMESQIGLCPAGRRPM